MVMNELSFIYHKTVEPSVKKYALCSNPRDGAVSRTYFPPSNYELARQNEFIHKEISRRAGFQKRKMKNIIENGISLEKRKTTSSKLPPIWLNERILGDYEPGKVFKETHANRQHLQTRDSSQSQAALAKIPALKTPQPVVLPGSKQANDKSEMRLRFEAEEDFIERVRMNKRLSNVLSHRVERFYYLQGGGAHLSPRSPTRLKLGQSNSFDSPLGLTYPTPSGELRKSPIGRVVLQNGSSEDNIPALTQNVQGISEPLSKDTKPTEEPDGMTPTTGNESEGDQNGLGLETTAEPQETAQNKEVHNREAKEDQPNSQTEQSEGRKETPDPKIDQAVPQSQDDQAVPQAVDQVIPQSEVDETDNNIDQTEKPGASQPGSNPETVTDNQMEENEETGKRSDEDPAFMTEVPDNQEVQS